jgi:hypothetical protein
MALNPPEGYVTTGEKRGVVGDGDIAPALGTADCPPASATWASVSRAIGIARIPMDRKTKLTREALWERSWVMGDLLCWKR